MAAMSGPVRAYVGSLAAAMPTGPTTILLDLGPDHPTRAGLLELRLLTDGHVITHAEVVVGAMHRGAEKLFEVRDYRQILMLADRHDWHASFSGELAAALACEDLLGLEVPPRAVWLRTLMAEHTRILSHLGFLSWLARGRSDLLVRVRRAREDLRTQNVRLSGNRIHPMLTRIGGLAADADAAWLAAETRLMADLEHLADALAEVPLTPSVAPVDTHTIDQYGLSGPLARAGAVPLDLRRTAPYLAYAELTDHLRPVANEAGDAAARLRTMIAEVHQSADLVSACAAALPTITGPVAVMLPKILRLPEAETYVAVEAPLGRAGFHVVSRGDKTPWRFKMRTPSFAHVAALERILLGCAVADLEYALASIGYVIGDVDK